MEKPQLFNTEIQNSCCIFSIRTCTAQTIHPEKAAIEDVSIRMPGEFRSSDNF